MRPEDFEEFIALSPFQTVGELALSLSNRYGDKEGVMTWWLGETPVAIGAAVEARPNVVTLFFFATEDFPKVAIDVTRFITRTLFPRLKEAGVHRIEAVSHHKHTKAHRWIELLGLRKECFCLGYGRDGSDYFQFSWVKHAVGSTSAQH